MNTSKKSLQTAVAVLEIIEAIVVIIVGVIIAFFTDVINLLGGETGVGPVGYFMITIGIGIIITAATLLGDPVNKEFNPACPGNKKPYRNKSASSIIAILLNCGLLFTAFWTDFLFFIHLFPFLIVFLMLIAIILRHPHNNPKEIKAKATEIRLKEETEERERRASEVQQTQFQQAQFQQMMQMQMQKYLADMQNKPPE